MKRPFLALVAIAIGAVVVPLVGAANAQRQAGLTHAEQQAHGIRELFARYGSYCGAGGAVGIEPGHIRMRPYPHGALPVADALRLPVGRVVAIYLLRCSNGRLGYVRDFQGGKVLTYFDGGKPK